MTIKLSDRLRQIASFIEPGESVCDIGTDHGFLPIFLVQQGGHDPVIMSDVSSGSLDKAVADAKGLLDADQIPDARLGDGLDVLAPGEVDDVVIAGMGGRQILDILSWDIVKTLTYRKYILQPRRDTALLRKWLEVNGFRTIGQYVAPENGRYSEIICVTSENAVSRDVYFYDRKKLAEVFDDPDTLAMYEYPDDLIDSSGRGMDVRFFETELYKTRMIISGIEDHSNTYNAALDMHYGRLRRLEKLLAERKKPE